MTNTTFALCRISTDQSLRRTVPAEPRSLSILGQTVFIAAETNTAVGAATRLKIKNVKSGQDVRL